MQVAICICTFKRPELLRNLLGGVALLTFHRTETPQMQIIVVDNDVSASAREICGAVPVPWPIQYVVEPTQGITHARNRAIAEAGGVDFIAFLDDDEVPSPQWLDELLWAQREFNAEVVSGPVFPNYAAGVAAWVKSGGFFSPRVSATGSVRKVCASNNVLIATRVFRKVPGFDDAFGLSGSEDTNFFLRVRLSGHKIVWSQDAAVFEAVSRERGSAAWLLRREYQTGNGWVFCEAAVDSSLRNWVVRFAKAFGHLVIGSANAILRLLTMDKAAIVRPLQRVSLGLGMLAALAGHRFLAYQNPETQQIPNREAHNEALRMPW